MGFLDFMYKKPSHRRSGYSRQTGSHYRPRVKTYVDRNTSMPGEYDNQRQSSRSQRKSNKSVNRISNDNHHHSSANYSYSNNERLSRRNNLPDDDFTRLTRMNKRIDSYIVRYNDINEELKRIEYTLTNLQKEFNTEYLDDILEGKKNRHIVEIGEEIIAKFDSFYFEKQRQKQDDKQQEKEEQEEKNGNETNFKRYDVKLNDGMRMGKTTITPPPPPPQLPPLVSETPEYTLARATYAIVKSPSPSLNNKSTEDLRISTTATTPIPTTSTVDQLADRPKSIFESNHIYSSPLKSSKSFGLVNDLSTETEATGTGTGTRISPTSPKITHLSLNSTNDNENKIGAINCLPQIIPPKYYLNLTRSMHSNNSTIELCFRRIDNLRPRIANYSSEHKYTVYKELNKEISDLISKLERLTSLDDNSQQDKMVALAELHNLHGVLERSITCHDDHCRICNPTNEISV